MDAKLKAQWIAALRSGEYKQGRNRLRGPGDSYCCLGVLCDILPEGEWSGGHYRYKGDTADIALPYSVVSEQFGGRVEMDSEGKLPFKDRSNTTVWLSTLNDQGLTFEQIADVIEWAY